jgi:sugar lactone lactonase YvrE
VFRPTGPFSLFCDGVAHAESLAERADGSILATCAIPTHVDPGPIVAITADGLKTSVFCDVGRRFLGLAVLEGGDVLGCDATNGAVVRLDQAGTILGELCSVDGVAIQVPNGIAVDVAGGIWVVDSGTAKAGEATGSVLFMEPAGTARIATHGLTYPNGIVVDDQRSVLYVAETRDDRVLRFNIRGPGKLDDPVVFASGLDGGPDGLSLDPDGSLYVALTRTSACACLDVGGKVEVLLESDLLRAPSYVHPQPEHGRLLVTSLLANTIHQISGIFA